MPRRARSVEADRIYHVCNHSDETRPLFEGSDQLLMAEQHLLGAKMRYPVNVLAYALTPQGWHLLLQPTEKQALAAFVGWFARAHARVRPDDSTHPLFRGRFRSFPLATEVEVLQLARYVERRPLCLGLCDRAADWRYASLHHRITGSEYGRSLLFPVALPSAWPRLVDAAFSETDLRQIRTSISSGRPLGEARACIRRNSTLPVERNDLDAINTRFLA